MDNKARTYRIYKGLSQREVARRVGISYAGYNAIERGLHTPNVIAGIRIARVLGTSVEKIWGACLGSSE